MGNRSGDLAAVTVERHPAAPDMIVLSTHVAESQFTDPLDGGRTQRFYRDLLFRFADQVSPAFGHIAYPDEGKTAFEAGLRNIDVVPPPQWWSFPKVLTGCRETLRGYSWLTILPQELLDRVGGLETLAGSGAFVEVRPLSAGGVWLLATDDYRAFDDRALLRVFHALSPALRPGPITLWPPTPDRPPLRVVPKDASRYRTSRSSDSAARDEDHAAAVSGDPTTPLWWTATVEHPDPAPVDIAPAEPDEIAQAVRVPGAAWWTVSLLVQAALPMDADPADAAQVLADAAGQWTRMPADVGHAPGRTDRHSRPTVGRLTVTAEPQPSSRHLLRPAGRRVHCTTNPATIFAHVDLAWAAAWKHHYGLSGRQKPVFIPIAADQFAIGYAAAQTYRTSHPSP